MRFNFLGCGGILARTTGRQGMVGVKREQTFFMKNINSQCHEYQVNVQCSTDGVSDPCQVLRLYKVCELCNVCPKNL